MLSLRYKTEPLTIDRMLEDVAASVEQHFGALDSPSDTSPLWTPLPGPQTLAVESEADELFFGGGGGGGKALDVETPIPTPCGWRGMGDLDINDRVYTDTGAEARITAISPVMVGRPCFEVEFDDGEVVVADGDHRWLTMTEKERKSAHRRTDEFRKRDREDRPLSPQTGRKSALFTERLRARNRARVWQHLAPSVGAVRTTTEILATLRVKRNKATNHSVALAGAITGRESTLLIDPYLLGLWLGDGTTRNATITTIDTEVIDAIRGLGYEVSQTAGTVPLGWRVYGLQPQLRALNLICNKHVPDQYLWAPVAARMALLNGLMDSDGTCETRGRSSFTNTNRGLIDAVAQLMASLGLKSTTYERRAKIGDKDCGPAWTIQLTTKAPIFRLARKGNRLPMSTRDTQQRRYIVDVRPCESRPVKCIAVDAPSRLYLAGRHFIPTHNTDLILGLAITHHRSSIIFRREFSQFRGPEGIIERSRQIIGLNGRLNENLYIWRGLPGGKAIEFGAVQHEDHKNRYKGRAHDLKAFDELPEFTETQYRFLNIWLRTAIPGQRTRVVGTGNPPTTAEGQWVLKYWAPWLDPHHPNPAKPGELRWFAVLDGKDVEVNGPAPIVFKGQTISPRSRTFIPAKVEDNPYYMRTGYADVLDNLPEPLRSQMRFGNFQAAQGDHTWQIIPTAWVRGAQLRWTPEPPPGIPLTAVGVDPSRGGEDEFVIAKRHAQWVAPLERHQGPTMPDGPTGAATIRLSLGDDLDVPVQIDIIGSAGASVYDQAKLLGLKAFGLNGSEASAALDKSGRLGFVNKRAEWHWRLREALDPTSGQDIALPPDPQLLSDLCAPRWKVTPRGIQVEAKDDIKKRIGRSPDRGEAVMYAIASESLVGASAVRAPSPGQTNHLERLRQLTARRRHASVGAALPPSPEPPPPPIPPTGRPRRWRRDGG